MSIQKFIKEETSGVKEYNMEEKKHPEKVYKQIIPDEKKHILLLKKALKKAKT